MFGPQKQESQAFRPGFLVEGGKNEKLFSASAAALMEDLVPGFLSRLACSRGHRRTVHIRSFSLLRGLRRSPLYHFKSPRLNSIVGFQTLVVGRKNSVPPPTKQPEADDRRLAYP